MFGGIFVLLLAWSLANPMFAAPDEDLHLARSQSTWLGDLSPPYSTDGVPVGAVRCFAFKPNTTADCMDTTWGPPTGSQLLPTTNGYPPFFSIIEATVFLDFAESSNVLMEDFFLISISLDLFSTLRSSSSKSELKSKERKKFDS